MRKFTQFFGTLFISLLSLACAQQDPLYKAIETGNIQQVTQLVSNGADVNKLLPNKATPLIVTSELGYTEIVKTLL